MAEKEISDKIQEATCNACEHQSELSKGCKKAVLTGYAHPKEILKRTCKCGMFQKKEQTVWFQPNSYRRIRDEKSDCHSMVVELMTGVVPFVSVYCIKNDTILEDQTDFERYCCNCDDKFPKQ